MLFQRLDLTFLISSRSSTPAVNSNIPRYISRYLTLHTRDPTRASAYNAPILQDAQIGVEFGVGFGERIPYLGNARSRTNLGLQSPPYEASLVLNLVRESPLP